mgnify:FL=1
MDSGLIEKLSSLCVLYVEDEARIATNMSEVLEEFFKEVYVASNGLEGLNLYKEHKPDLIITDIVMPKLNGLDMTKKIRLQDKEVGIIIVSAHTDLPSMLQAVELNLLKYIVKPITQTKLLDALHHFVKSQQSSENEHYLAPSWTYKEHLSLVIFEQTEYTLTKKENLFLKALLREKRILGYAEIDYIIENEDSLMSQNALRLFIKNIRKKLPPNAIENVQAIGYKLALG